MRIVWYQQVERWGKRNSAMWSLWNLLMLLICLTPKSTSCLEPPSLLWYAVFSYLCLHTNRFILVSKILIWSKGNFVEETFRNRPNMELLLVFLVCLQLEQRNKIRKCCFCFGTHLCTVALQGLIKPVADSSSLPYRKVKRIMCISLILYQIKITKTEIQNIDFYFILFKLVSFKTWQVFLQIFLQAVKVRNSPKNSWRQISLGSDAK